MTNIINHIRRPDIRFYRSGKIIIMARLARLLSLKKGDAINIAVENEEFLLHTLSDPHNTRLHARCFPSKKGKNTFCVQSVALSRTILDNTDLNTNKLSFLVGDPVTINNKSYFPIITRLPL